ncbi:MAG: hypothetical protein OXC46_11450 [Thaumarchaeota archaeon]|nr:hypothetical protein [Nitrososphaerota archaeon]
MKKNVVAGLGEIGGPILKLISRHCTAVGYDTNSKLNSRLLKKYDSMKTSILHICIPSTDIEQNVQALFRQFKPELITIHSTIPPGTTSKLQKRLPIPVMYSPTRGIHGRMLKDLQRYTKYFALEADAPRPRWAASTFKKLMEQCSVKTKKMSKPVTLELAKLVVDTSYYGWLISYAQISKMIANKYDANYDEMWDFSDEIHKYLGNRPRMFPGVIGGHCILQNLELIDEKKLYEINNINDIFTKMTQLHEKTLSGK